MLTLLSPAKTLDFDPAPKDLEGTPPEFQKDSKILLKRMRELGVDQVKDLLKVSQPLAELNHERFETMKFPFTAKNAKPCVLAFRGDVYRKLDAPSLSKRDLNWAKNRLRILSGFYGLLRPLDLIQPYRLEMGTKLDNPRGRDLYVFWGNRLADSINQLKPKAVLNLASNEYIKAVPEARLEPPMVTAVFQEIRDGSPRTIAFSAKRARGMMARFVITNRVDRPEGLKDFAEAGYKYRAGLSSPERMVFIRPGKRS